MMGESGMEDSTFQWLKVAHGWISFALDGGSGQYRCTVSDASDVISDLLLAVTRVVRGSSRECISFDHEPTEIRWTITSVDGTVLVLIESFETWGSAVGGHSEWRGAWPNTRAFGSHFLVATETFLEQVGSGEYSSGWPSYPMPVEAVSELRKSMSSAAG
jgi:hypothetical protein